MVIRICTKDKNHERIRELCAKRFDAFTIYHGMGAWKGQLEPSMTIDIATFPKEAWMSCLEEQHKAVNLAREIKEMNNQESVLIEYIESTNVLI